ERPRRIAGTLPEPAVESSPPQGVAAIVGLPVFVHVTNWTGVVTAQECAGFCVTVSATPALTFHPGETGASAVDCAGAGTVYEPGAAAPDEQAAGEGACTHRYALRTGIPERPHAWSGSVSVTWTITWTATNGASGTLPSVTRTTVLERSVEEGQAVVNGGITPCRRRCGRGRVRTGLVLRRLGQGRRLRSGRRCVGDGGGSAR